MGVSAGAQTVSVSISDDCSKNGVSKNFVTTGNASVSSSSGRTSCEWVQLWEGGPKWATFNVGATITNYANLTVGADATPFYGYTTDQAPYYNTANVGGLYAWNQPNYNGRQTTWTEDGITTGVADVATTLWGSNWETPTYEQLDTLRNSSYGKTTWTWCDGSTTQYVPGCTLKGYKVSGVGAYADKCIFLPAAGDFDYRDGTVYNASSDGKYWSSTMAGSDSACYLDFYSSRRGMNSGYREYGQSGRAVLVETNSTILDPISTQDRTLTLYADGCESPNTFICPEGQQLLVNATPMAYRHFVAWNDGNTDNPRTVAVSSDTTFTAIFEPMIKISSGNVASLSGASQLWPILLDDDTYNSVSNYVVADFRPNDIDKFLYIWDNTYIKNVPTGLNSYGRDGYLSLTVNGRYGWSGAGYSISNTSLSAAESLRQAIIADPDKYFLHFAIKSTTPGSHAFAIFGADQLNFAVGGSFDGASSIGDYSRDGEWHEFNVSMSNFTSTLANINVNQIKDLNIFYFLSGGVPSVQLDLDAIYFYRKDNGQTTPSINNDSHGYVLGTGYYYPGKKVTLTAVPSEHYHFVQWSDGNTDNPRVYYAMQDSTFTAEFAENTYTISTSSNYEECSTAGDSTALYGSYVAISATAGFGYSFKYWSDGSTENPRVVHVEGNRNYYAIFTPNMYEVSIINANPEMGTVCNGGRYEYGSVVTLTASSFFGYEFNEWSDGNTDNPRQYTISGPATLTASFRLQKAGMCGNSLQWQYQSGTLYISGLGEMYDYTASTMPWYLLRDSIQTLVINGGITKIGNYAFYALKKITKLTLPESVTYIGEYAFGSCKYITEIFFPSTLSEIADYVFYDCPRVSDMTSYASVTPEVYPNTLSSISSLTNLHIPAGCLRTYQLDPYWSRFVLMEIGAEAVTTPVEDVVVEPSENEAEFTWPTSTEAASYSLEITKDGVVFCTLTFNANGQLTGLAFAPGRNGAEHAAAATTSVAGMTFTVTGMDASTAYAFSFEAKDASQQVVESYTGTFETAGYQAPNTPTELEHVDVVNKYVDTPTKLLRDGQVLIQRGDRLYDLRGQEVK